MTTRYRHRSLIRPFALAASLSAGLLSADRAGAATVIADSVADYSDVQGQDNWYYGYFDGDGGDPFGPGDFEQLTYGPSSFLAGVSYWQIQDGPGGYWTLLDEIGGHPNGLAPASNRLRVIHWAVRRYVSEVDGLIQITGNLRDRNGNGGDGVTGRIFVDGVEVFTQSINNGDATGFDYDFTVTVNAGSIIDFAIDSKGNDQNDATGFDAVITQVPEPTSLALAAMGLLCMTYRRRRD